MAFMKKEELLAEAERLGIDISSMKYQEQVAAVAKAQRAEAGLNPGITGAFSSADTDGDRYVQDKRIPEKPKRDKAPRNTGQEALLKEYEKVKNKRIIIAPAIRPESANVLFKYEEDLGDDMDVEEVYLGLETLGSPQGDVNRDATYKTRKNGRRALAMSSFPKENAGIDYRPADWFPTITDPVSGKTGYQWKKYVKPLLLKSGFYQEYADYFDYRKNPNNIYYISGWCCVRKELIDWIFEDINKKIAERNKRNNGFPG